MQESIKFTDIMNKRYKMTRIERAKQFAPFDALTGLGKAIKAMEEEYEKVHRHELSEDELSEINAELCVLEEGDAVRLSYYCGGTYYDAAGFVVCIDSVRKILHLTNDDNYDNIELTIPFADIRKIERM